MRDISDRRGHLFTGISLGIIFPYPAKVWNKIKITVIINIFYEIRCKNFIKYEIIIP